MTTQAQATQLDGAVVPLVDCAAETSEGVSKPCLTDAPKITMTPSDLREMLDRKLTERRNAQLRATVSGKRRLQLEMNELALRIKNLDATHQSTVTALQGFAARMETFAAASPRTRFDAAQKALTEGDTRRAYALLSELEESIFVASDIVLKATLLRAEIAEQDVRWLDAANHYLRASNEQATFETVRKASEMLWQAAEYGQSIKMGETLINLSFQQFGEENVKSAAAMTFLALKLQQVGELKAAEPLHREALRIGRAKLAGNDAELAAKVNNLAGILLATQRYEEAEPLFREALDIRRTLHGEEHQDYAISLNNLAGMLRNAGRLSEAETHYRQSLEVLRTTVGEDHPDYAGSVNNLAGLLTTTNQFNEAEVLYREVLMIARNELGGMHPRTASSLNNLAGLLTATERFEEAEPLYREALTIARTVLGDLHLQTAGSLNNLAGLLQATGRLDEAEPLYREALDIVETTLGFEHPSSRRLRENLHAFLTERKAALGEGG